MDSILSQVNKKVNAFFDEKTLRFQAKQTQFMQRIKKINPKLFLEAALCLRLSSPKASLEDFSHELSKRGCYVTKQAVHLKMNANTPLFLRQLLDSLLMQIIQSSSSSLLATIPEIQRIQVIDSSELHLNEGLKAHFPQVRRQGAALKLQTLIDVLHYQVERLDLRPSNEPDQAYKLHQQHVQAGDLYLADLGYFDLNTFTNVTNQSAYFLSRHLKTAQLIHAQTQKKIDLPTLLSKKNTPKTLEIPVQLGKSKLACRFVAIRLTRSAYRKRLTSLKRKQRQDGRKRKRKIDALDKWTLFVTNVPLTVKPDTLLTLYALRWQVELFFKMSKQWMALKNSESRNPHRAVSDVYLSLIAIALLCNVLMTLTDKEISLYKAGKIFAAHMREFIQCVNNNKRCPIHYLRQLLYERACKESRTNRLSTKQKIEYLLEYP